MIGDKLKKLRSDNSMTQAELANILKISPSSVGMYEQNRREPDSELLKKIAELFNVSIDYILDREPKRGIKIPVLGRVQAGIPVEAIEDILDYEEITPELARRGEFFALKIRGDSMNPRMLDGDVVIVRQQPDVENGEIGIVLVNGYDATVKKVKKTGEGIYLIPLNPDFDPLFYSREDVETLPVAIIGKVVELRGKF